MTVETEQFNWEEYNTGIGTIIIDNKEMKIIPTLNHKRRLWALQQKLSEKNRKGELSEEDSKKVDEILVEIIKQAYPNMTDTAIDNFMMQHSEDFQLAIYEKFGWIKKGEMDDLKKKLIEKQLEKT